LIEEAMSISLLSLLKSFVFLREKKIKSKRVGTAILKKAIVVGGRSSVFTKNPVDHQIIAAVMTSI